MPREKGSQVWFCAECQTLGVVKYDMNEDAYSVLSSVNREHDRAGASGCFVQPRILILESVHRDSIFMGVGAQP